MTREAELRDKAMKIDHNVFRWIYNQGRDLGITETNSKWKQAVQKLKETLAKEQESWTNGDGATLISNHFIDKIFGDKLL